MKVDGPTPIMLNHNSRNGTELRVLLKLEDNTYLLRETNESKGLLYEELAETWDEALIAFSIRSGHAVRKEHFERRSPEPEPEQNRKKEKKDSEETDLN